MQLDVKQENINTLKSPAARKQLMMRLSLRTDTQKEDRPKALTLLLYIHILYDVLVLFNF